MLRDSFDHLVINWFLNVQPRTRAAALAVVKEDGAGRTGNGDLEIGVFEDNVRRLPTQLQRSFLEVPGGRMDNQLADFSRSSEGDLVNVGMSGQRRPCRLAITGDNVDHAFGEAGFHDQIPETQRGERSLLGWLQHDGAARS